MEDGFKTLSPAEYDALPQKHKDLMIDPRPRLNAFQRKIFAVFKDLEGPADINSLIQAYIKLHKKEPSSRGYFVSSGLYRLKKKKYIKSVGKGFFAPISYGEPAPAPAKATRKSKKKT